MVWYDMTWYDATWYDVKWYPTIWTHVPHRIAGPIELLGFDLSGPPRSAVRFPLRAACHKMIATVIWYMIWYDTGWHNAMEYDMVWHDMR